MKKRIWKKILAAGVCLLAQAGILAGCTVWPAVAKAAGTENEATISQEAVWTDTENFQARICVRAAGLEGLIWENTSENTSENFEDQEDESLSTENSYELVVWLSEYFQPATSFAVPDGCLREELPIITADGRSSSIMGLRWKIAPGEISKQLEIPVVLREEYRFPKENTVLPTCQDILHGNGVLSEEENGSGVYILKKAGNEKSVLCKTDSQGLEVAAANMDFKVEMNPREADCFSGSRIYMEVTLTNNGQVPFYGISLQAMAKDVEVVPVWEKEPGFEVTEDGAVLESLSAGEVRMLSFYVDTEVSQKGNLMLEAFAKAENPVPLERTAEYQMVIQPLKPAFTVKKTADCENASPGDSVNYQISIHNTGEITLHSVITTERFGLAGVTARFLEQDGVILNRSKTQAKIPEIVPGGCVNLKARVVLPENLEDQDLVNQIIVVTDETGEESAVRDQATIHVQAKKEEKGNGGNTGNGSANSGGMAASTAPKTGDRSHKEVFQALILLSFFLSAVSVRRMFFPRKD